jgi:hypothetical protein
MEFYKGRNRVTVENLYLLEIESEAERNENEFGFEIICAFGGCSGAEFTDEPGG